MALDSLRTTPRIKTPIETFLLYKHPRAHPFFLFVCAGWCRVVVTVVGVLRGYETERSD